MPLLVAGPQRLRMDEINFSVLFNGTINTESGTTFRETVSGFQWGVTDEVVTFTGSGFTYDSDGVPTGGTVTSLSVTHLGQTVFQISQFSEPASLFVAAAGAQQGASWNALSELFNGSDTLVASDTGDHLFGFYGNDSIVGGAGDDYLNGAQGNSTLTGGAGADTLDAGGYFGQHVLYGGDGNDLIRGGNGTDTVNGNKGDDTIIGSSTVGDWLLGGQGNDSIKDTASSGHNIINGNIGNDTILCGSGGNSLRGGQGDDSIVGGQGADWLSGDMGHDTLTGGGGADTFHIAANNTQTIITDFSYASGDRILLDTGSTYTVSASGSDTVIDVSSGAHVILQGIDANSLPAGAILLG